MSEAKKIKLDSSGPPSDKRKPKHGKAGKRNYYAKAQDHGAGDRCLKPGHRGFLVTCNGHVRDCIRDSYRILNAYADELYGTADKTPTLDDNSGGDGVESNVPSDEEDISIKLQKEAEAASRKQNKSFRFQNVDSGALNCLFIQTTLTDPNEMAVKLMKDLSATKKHKSRFILRMLPIQAVCRANLKDIIDAVGRLSDLFFLKEPKTYAVIFNRRLNNDLSRDDVIREVAELITTKNAGNKANLKCPQLAVIVEVIKGLCCIGILPDYYQLRKYNLVELVAQQSTASAMPVKGDDSKAEEESTQKSQEAEDKLIPTAEQHIETSGQDKVTVE
ncbi:THUMP domain-containing protein 1 homolog [Anopheles maculipalpis]|uniref:THUMP domain-containing protein 1 homolog n=1 Tax=Anopheles maculipalpis TaxID=1496333 RepID=UPI0021594B2C|nr:THUMP domain-containing protein 1 homolog [Anopheles maculipalpis]